MKLTAVEGNTQKLDGGSMFGNAPKAMWARWIEPDELNRIPLACRSLLLELDDGRKVLLETGVGAFFEPKLRERYGVQESEHVLIENLEKLGVQDSDIDIIILSHLHFDHAGGLLSAHGDGETRLLFPNATIYTGKEHWERAQKPHIRERVSFLPELNNLLANSGRFKLIDQNAHPDLDFGITFQFVHGHTIGLMLSEIQTPTGPVTFVSDLMPGKPWAHLPITMGYDRFPELVVNEKQAFLADAVERDLTVFFTHDPFSPWARIEQDDRGKYRAVEAPPAAGGPAPQTPR